MAVITPAFSGVNALTITNLNSNTSSTTAAWASAVIDNTGAGTSYLDAQVQVVFAMAASAPANDKALYVYAWGGLQSTVLSNPITGTEADVTLPDFTANALTLRLIGVVPYNATSDVIKSSPLSVAAAFGGMLPPFWGVAVLDYSGAALLATGNAITWRGITLQVS